MCEYVNAIYISIDYKYNGREFNELEISQMADSHEVVLTNRYDGEIFRTKDFDELAQFVKDLKAGKYANGKGE